jgi:hypothetical protein
MFKKPSPRDKGKEREEDKAILTSKLKQRTPAEKEARKKGPYVADFDRKQTFDLDIDPTVKRPFNSGSHPPPPGSPIPHQQQSR